MSTERPGSADTTSGRVLGWLSGSAIVLAIVAVIALALWQSHP